MTHVHSEVSSYAADIHVRGTTQAILEGSLMTALDVVGVLGNLMVCLVVYQRKNFRRVANIYVVALALSDILMATICEPLSCAFLFMGEWAFGDTACTAQGCLSFFAAFFSLQTMTAMALNRYFRVVKSNQYRKLFSVRRTFISLFIITGTSLFGAGITAAAGLAEYSLHYGKSFCFLHFPTPQGEKTFIVMMHLFYVTIPLSIVSVCYYKIFQTVRAHTKETFQPALPGQEASVKIRSKSQSLNVEEVKISKVLFGTVLGFTICWTPIAIIDLVDAFSDHTLAIPRQVFLMYAFLGYGSSSINPFIYGIMNREFRLEFLNILRLSRKSTRVQSRNRSRRHSNKVEGELETKNAEGSV